MSDLRDQISARLTRWKRQWDDEARVPPGLLDELAALADARAARYARECVAAVSDARPPLHQPPGSGFSAAVHPGVMVGGVNPFACPNDPPCPHSGLAHDVYDLPAILPRCCTEGCDCGKGQDPA